MKKSRFGILATVLCVALCLSLLPHAFSRRISARASEVQPRVEDNMADSGLNYTESTENMINPDRGFYQALAKTIPVSSSDALWGQSAFNTWCSQYGIMHLRLGLENFSSNAGGTDGPVSDTALDAVENTLNNIRRAGGSAIVRFSYDINGAYPYHDNEPSLELIETHIAQLGEVLSRNADVVVSLETGMVGPWGEQHSTTLAKSGQQTFYRIVEAWLKALPEGRTVSVRQPLFYRYWANEKYGTSLTASNMSSDVTVKGTDAYRVGLYNDGYLGSASDLGTFQNRAVETQWLQNQATHTLYGGEVVADSSTGLMGQWNDAAYVEQEAFVTHTTYLNQAWNDRVVSNWASNAYTGTDPVYAGKTQYNYIATHLGYRLVLRKSELSSSVSRGGTFRLTGQIENVGFGNVVNEKVASIMLVSGDRTETCVTDFDVRDILSQETKEYDMTFKLPSNIPAGNYAVYMRIRDKEEKTSSAARSILFANVNGYDATLRANKLGTLTVTQQTEQGSDTFKQVDGTIPEFTVRFSAEDGTENIPSDIIVEGGNTVTIPAQTPTRHGYVFVGWNDGTTTYNAGESYRVLQNVTLTAKWEKAVFTVTFDGDGGTLTDGEATQQVEYLEAATAPTFEKTGHTFAGWDKAFDSVSDNLEVKALWDAEIYTVRFLSREEATLVSGESKQNVAYGTAATPPVYAREGYKLKGWSGDYSCITGHCVFYAEWEKEDAGGGSGNGCKSSVGASSSLGVLLILAAVMLVKRKSALVNKK